MLIWLLSGVAVMVVAWFFILRDAIADDKRRKIAKPSLRNNW